MKIRIISDLHLDVNQDYPLMLPNKDRGTFTLIAGDTAGHYRDYIDWIKDNCPYGILVAGNHLVYNNYGLSVQDLKADLRQYFPECCTIRFLDNDVYTFIDSNIMIIGSTLYTNCHLNGIPTYRGKSLIERGLNDFRLGKYFNGEKLVRLNGDHHVQMFNESFEFIKKTVEENPTKDIIIVTHHAPSNQSIATYYKDSKVNCGYASNLGGFIIQHPNIKCWVHGHVHNYNNYLIGNCRVISNPRGYVRYGEDYNWNPMFYLDTDTWETSFDEEWFKREISEEEKQKRKELDDAYNTLFGAMI